MRKMRGWVALAAIAFLLGTAGCSALSENNNTSDLPKLESNTAVGQGTTQVITPALYFPDKTTGKLTAQMRELEITEGSNGAETLAQALLNGPVGEGLTALSWGISLERAELCGEVANVFLTADRVISEQIHFLIGCAFANSFINYYGISYVCVFINGNTFSIEGAPCGPFKKNDGDVDTLYKEYKAKYAETNRTGRGTSVKTDVVLYYPSKTLDYILCEVRQVELTPGKYAEQILREQSAGVKYKDFLVNVFDTTKSWQLNSEYNTDLGHLSLAFNEDPFFKAEGVQPLYAAALCYTLTSALPNMQSVTVEIGGEDVFAAQKGSGKLVGEAVTLYFPSAGAAMLVKEKRSVSAKLAWSLDEKIRQLIAGPGEAEEERVRAAFPKDIGGDDLLGVVVDGSTVIVNFSGHVALSMPGMSDEDFSLAIYSIVNTLCTDSRIKKVQFLIEGERIESFGGRISVFNPLLPNPGVVSE